MLFSISISISFREAEGLVLLSATILVTLILIIVRLTSSTRRGEPVGGLFRKRAVKSIQAGPQGVRVELDG